VIPRNGGKGAGDGRHIDLRVGALEGEGARQTVHGEAPEALHAYDVWRASQPADDRGTYYGRPVLKEPVWIWAVPAYFYVGGAAGAAVVLGEAAESFADGADGLVRKARWIGAAGGAVGTALLIHDLGRPERFLHMLRVFRPTSPMSVGSWVLAAASPVFAASALLPRGRRGWGRLGNVAGKTAAALGLPLAGYTAALLSTTAVPLWQEIRRSLPFLFVASAAESAAALLELTELNDIEARIVRRFGAIAQLCELVAAWAVGKEAARVESVGEPLRSGPSGALWRASQVASVTGLALTLIPGSSRDRRMLSGVFGTAGSLALRFGVFHAGKASARDPRAATASGR
jgi:formate-dependent nitrite reductase membrane component NrfD